MPYTIGTSALRTEMREVLQLLKQGESVLVTHYNVPVGMLVPVGRGGVRPGTPRPPRLREGKEEDR